MTGGPSALVCTSDGAETAAAGVLIAALEVAGVSVRAIGVGRVGARSAGAVDRVLRAVLGELDERRLTRELAERPPDVAVGFDPGTVRVLAAARDEASRPFPVVAVVAELAPGEAWGEGDADRYLAVDDEAAVALADAGVAGDRIVPVGAFVAHPFAAAGREARSAVRARFKLPASGPVVLVEVAGLGFEDSSEVALKLSLTSAGGVFLFDAGRDTDAATALRQTVPMLDLRAKLFGATADAPQFWRAADVVIARPSAVAVARSLAVGARMVALSPEGAGADRASALEQRKRGRSAASALLISSALEAVLAMPEVGASAGQDGAGTAANAIWLLGSARQEVVDERQKSAARRRAARVDQVAGAAARAAASAAPPGDLEDLGGGGARTRTAQPGPDPREIARLQREVRDRRERAQRTVTDAQKGAKEWQEKLELARRHDNADMARHAERNADLERARMHAALAELAELEAESRRLDEAAANAAKAPPPRPEAPPRPSAPRGGGTSTRAPRTDVDAELEDLKRRAQSGGGAGAKKSGASPRPGPASSGRGPSRGGTETVDDELAALKRKMAAQRRKR